MNASITNDIDSEQALTRLARTVLSDIPDAIVFTDLDGVIRYWNNGASRVFGFTREDALGQSLNIIIPEKLRERHWDGYRRVIETGRSRYGTSELLSVPALTKDRGTISVQFTIAIVRDDDGDITGLVALLRDFTKHYSELKRLKSAK